MTRNTFSLSALIVAFGFICLMIVPVTVQAQSTPIAIQRTTIIDVTDGSLLPHQTVLIRGNKIAAISPVGEITIPNGAKVIEAKDTYLIPGLWDMHAHALGEYRELVPFFKTLIANGVTGIRDPQNSSRELEAMVESATVTGPVRMVVAGNLVDGGNPGWPGILKAGTPERGRDIVDSLAAVGAPFIKVYSKLDPKTYFAIAGRAREVGIPFMGHVPLSVSAGDASDAGQRSIEHFTGVMLGCTPAEEKALGGLNAWREAVTNGDTTLSENEAIGRRFAAMRSAPFDEQRCRELLAKFAENQTWQVPTLVTAWGFAFGRDSLLANDSRMPYVPPGVRSYWKSLIPKIPPFAKKQFRRQQRIAGLLEDMNVPLLIGTDMPAIPMVIPGFSVHHEMKLLVEAGLSSLYVLQAATLNPARFFRMTDSLGTVAEGKLADLVLLEANPLEHISNTKRIRAVIANGRLYGRDRLDALLTEVAKVNKKHSLATILLETFNNEGLKAVREQYMALRKTEPDTINFSEWELLDLAHSLLNKRHKNEATTIFKWSIEAYPNSPYSYGAFADALEKAGSFDEALTIYKKAAKVAGDHNHPSFEYFNTQIKRLIETSNKKAD